MRVVFLGTGGYHPNERRHTLSILLPEVGVVFDAGTSLFRIADCLESRDLQIFLSHSHLDHVVGLTYLLVPMANGLLERVRVIADQKTLSAVQQHLFSTGLFPVVPDYEFESITSETNVSQNGILTHIDLNHPGGSRGFRVDWPDRSMAYITDTIADGTYASFVAGVDLLIHECNFPDRMAEWSETTGHSHTTPVVELARDAEVGRLILVHIDPEDASDDPIGLEHARSIFPNTDVAEDLLEIDF